MSTDTNKAILLVTALAAILVSATSARAEDRIAALAPAADARQAIAIGPLGQVYEPDGHGAWARVHDGGTAAEIVTATRGEAVIAGTRDAPPFMLVGDSWAVVYLGLKAKAIVGAGPRATAASGHHVFALDGAAPVELPLAPADVLGVGASTGGVAITSAQGTFRLQGRAWKPIANAPAKLVLLSDRWALSGDAVVDLRTGKPATPADVHVVTAVVLPDDRVLAISPTSAGLELVTLRAGKVAREALPLAHDAPVVALTGDRNGRVVIALRDGRLAVRDPAATPSGTPTWTITEIRTTPPPAKPGPGPALTQ